MKLAGTFHGKRVLWLGAVAVGVVLLLVPRIFKSTPASFTTVRAQDALETVLAAGRVIGEKSVPLSFVRPGRITDEFIRDGDRVEANHILMRQDGRHEEQALAQARIALAEARLRKEKLHSVDLVDAEEKVRQAAANDSYGADFFKRQSELLEQKTITLLQFEQSRRDRELAASVLTAAQNQLRSLREVQTVQADLGISRAESDLNKAELDLGDTFLKAPMAGRIVFHDAHPGEFVSSGQKVVTFIPDAPRTYIEIQVDETNAGRITPGQKAAVSSAAFPGRIFSGEVERLGAIVDAQRGSFSVRLVLDRFEPELLPESSVSVQITTGRATGVLLLEQRFILQEGGDASVYVAEGRRAKRVSVSVRDLGNGFFECRKGLRSGQAVLLPQGLKDGLRVRLKPLPE
jgi:multidrug resistance efflux pump